MKPTIEQVKEIRLRTALGLNEIMKACEAVNTYEEVYDYLAKQSVHIASRRGDKEAKVRVLEAYVHHNGKCASLVEFGCETDFVANSITFRQFMRDICIHVAGHDPSDPKDLDSQAFVKDESMLVQDLINKVSAATGEKIEVKVVASKRV